MSSIKTLNRKRGNILAQLTKLSSKPLDNLSEFELRTTLDLLYDIKEKFEDIKQAYFEIDNDKEFKDVEPILNKIDEDIQDFQVSGKLLLYKFTEVDKLKHNNSSEHANNVRLPKIPLPQFDGQFNNWSSFKNQFHNFIENNPKLSDSQKLFYLNASLKDTRLDDTLRSFWEIKALPEKTLVDNELKYCMEHFDATHTRDSYGRYVVQRPIIKDKVQLGSSKDMMVKGLNGTLIRLNRSPDVKKLYNDFYVDDVLSCAPDLETAIEIQPQLIGMMNAGRMHLYKWCSNSRHLLSKVSTDDQEYVVGNDDLIRNNIWWSGPDLLHRDVDFTNNWDCSNTDPLYMKELKPIMNTFVQSTVPAEVLQEKNVADIFLTSRELNHARDVLL
ncbi:uncharacterized protein TNCT_637591 [Trichonephila clavata]|uniref:Uncharacterized protein n=1 Tax=Trichonephila clavata TaxID=2740835 RepID=A0A8X6H6S5_TRICU|nr:uncharacterized protein TNCT_637591 [Trichonephila clavata]